MGHTENNWQQAQGQMQPKAQGHTGGTEDPVEGGGRARRGRPSRPAGVRVGSRWRGQGGARISKAGL